MHYRRHRLADIHIRLKSLSQSLVVYEYGNLTHAARALGVSQSSVSQRLRELERGLGIKLFERQHRGMYVTPAGRHFFENVRPGLDRLDYAVKSAGMIARGEAGALRVGLFSSMASGFMPTLLDAYRQTHPDIELLLTEADPRDLVHRVREQTLDIVFISGIPDIEDCHTRHFWSERLLVVIPDAHPLNERERIVWADLANDTFILNDSEPAIELHDHITRRLSGTGKHPKVRRHEVERDTLLNMVARGLGISLIGDASTGLGVRGIKYRPIADEPDPVPFSAVWHPFNRNQALQNLLKLAQTQIRQTPPAISTP